MRLCFVKSGVLVVLFRRVRLLGRYFGEKLHLRGFALKAVGPRVQIVIGGTDRYADEALCGGGTCAQGQAWYCRRCTEAKIAGGWGGRYQAPGIPGFGSTAGGCACNCSTPFFSLAARTAEKRGGGFPAAGLGRRQRMFGKVWRSGIVRKPAAEGSRAINPSRFGGLKGFRRLFSPPANHVTCPAS